MSAKTTVLGAAVLGAAPPAEGRPGGDGRWLLSGALGSWDGQGRLVSGPAELVVREGVIERLEMLSPDEPGQRHIPRHGQRELVLAPLFVNAHDHGRGAGNVAAGIQDGPLEPWVASLRDCPRSTQDALVGEGSRLMVASGVGASVICVNPQKADTRAEVVAAARASVSRGMRAAIVYPLADTMDDLYGRPRHATGWDEDEIDRRLAEVEEVADEVEGPLVDVQLGPVGPQWVSEATLRSIGRHAQRTGRRVHMHLLESRAQRLWADATYPEGLVCFLDKVGLAGPATCFAHGTQLRDEEFEVLAGLGCILAVAASSNLRLCSGISRVAAAVSSGVHLGAGLDGLALADDADYWAELRLLRGIAQAQGGSPVDASMFMDRLAEGGRRALGTCAPAAPAPGARADFQLLDITGYEHLLEQEHWAAADVALAIGRPQRVAEVWVDGRCLLGGQNAA